MRRVSLKSAIAIIIYSLILAIVLGIGLYKIKNSFNSINNKPDTKNFKAIVFDANANNEIFYEVLKQEKFYETVTYNKSELDSILNSTVTADMNKIGELYLKTSFDDIIKLVIVFFFFFTLASIILWIVLNKIHNKEIEKIVKKLNEIDDDFNPYIVSEAFGLAYEKIKKKFKKNLEDYKKLNSYLSHEQKNAIAILRTNLEIDDKKEYIKLLDNITQSIDDIVTLSEVRIEEEVMPVDVALVCASVCDMYQKTYRNIKFDFEEDEDMIILGKERWIYRAVSNLVDNAVKYGNGEQIEVFVESKHNSVVVKVKDNGIGMEKGFIENIFDNKYRINDLKKDGYGIGLSLVSHVCDLCDGIVIVDSEIDKGSCFYLSFLQYNEH
ncbi:MAG: sensor histidine kinase [Sarcina sp.]